MPHLFLNKKRLIKMNRLQSFSGAISQVVLALSNIGNTVGRVLADRKISGNEYFDLLLAAPSIQVIVQQAPQAAKDWNVLSDAERETAVNSFAAQFNIPNEEAERKIEQTLRDAVVLYTSAERMVKAVKNINKTWRKEADAEAQKRESLQPPQEPDAVPPAKKAKG